MGDDLDILQNWFGVYNADVRRRAQRHTGWENSVSKEDIKTHENFILSRNDAEKIAWSDAWTSKIISALSECKNFSLGDYVVVCSEFDDSHGDIPIKNTYGVPIKFKIVAISGAGIPMLKEINHENKPVGEIFCMLHAMLGEDPKFLGGKARFILDEDYAESIIIGHEYDPMKKHNEKKSLRKEINDHNKLHKLKLSSVAEACQAMTFFKKGDVLWISNQKQFLISDVTSVPTPKGTWEDKQGNPRRYPHKTQQVIKIEVMYGSGEIATLLPHDIVHTNLYTARPRSLKELSDFI